MAAVAVLVFVAVFLGVVGIFFAVTNMRAAARLKRRLHRLPDLEEGYQVPVHELLRKDTAAEQLLYGLPPVRYLKRLVEQAGVLLAPLHFLVAVGAAVLLLTTLAFLWKGILAAAPAFLLAAVIPLVFLQQRKKKRLEKFTEQLPDALSIMSRSLRAGHSLTSAVELVAEELAEPSRSLFKLAYDQQKLGMRMAESLATLTEKIDSMDLQFLVTIIRINSDAGGNLSEVLDKLADTVRSRLQIRRQVEVFTAEGRFSGIVLVLLPIVVFVTFNLMRPEYMSVFFTEKICQLWLVGAICAQIVGYLIIRKIVAIRI